MKKTILVTGDPICDHNYYKGKRLTADSDEKRGFRYYRAGGGALLLKDLIAATMKGEDQGEQEWVTEFGLDPDFESLPLKYHSYCFWEPQAGGGDKAKTEYWRAIEPPLGYGHPAEDQPTGSCPKPRTHAYSPRPTPLTETPDMVVIDDAGIGFRDVSRRSHWSFAREGSGKKCPDWIVLKLTGPIGKSALWDEITSQCKHNLVVVVPAEALRRRNVRLSRGLSWEATAEDLTAELRSNPQLTPLLEARHLIVTFQSDGAFWFDNSSEGAKSLLVFDASRAEGEWSESQGKGGAFGYLSCLTAAVVRELCLPSDKSEPNKLKTDFEAALGAGLSASRELRQIGHGEVVVGKEEPKPGFPFEKIVAKVRQPAAKFVSALIPQGERKRGSWMMLDEWQVLARSKDEPRPHYEAALAVAVLGPEVLERFPVAQFGKYQTVDRKEIESLRTIRQLINNYLEEDRPEKPLNLAVFGPPGSGKTFIVKQIAKAVNIRKQDVLLFNLSQFKDADDICGAFHQIRDKALERTTPFVFWDEFDSQGYRWLQYLLAPMEDGEFQDGQITHPLGKCIFAFAGATSVSFDTFGPINPNQLGQAQLEYLESTKPDQLREVERAWREFVLAKGPDFKSRLVAFLNLLGMNCRQKCEEKDGRRWWKPDRSDLCFPIRRALFIRSLFDLKKGEELRLDLSVVRALLHIPTYKGAGRSLGFLSSNLRNDNSGRPGRSSMPGYELLDMHVNAEEFWELCEQDMEFAPTAAALARGLHEDWLGTLSEEQKKENPNAKPWDKLYDDTRNSNVAQAVRIPSIVALAGLRVVRGGPVSTAEAAHIAKTIEEHAEVLAEAEHNGWMVERMLAGWRYARLPKKDPVKKLHPLLMPFAQLHQAEQDKDRRVVMGQKAVGTTPMTPSYLERVQRVGFRIEPAPQEVKV
jgi:hypothetical protein